MPLQIRGHAHTVTQMASALLSTVISWFTWSNTSEVCQRELPQMYAGFVDHLVDTLHARGPVSAHASLDKPQAGSCPPLRLPPVERLVAIGDLHGDFEKARRAFRIGGLIDEHDRWCGGTATAVQVGDQLDRGSNEVRILYFLERLQSEAAKAGGALHILTGNHETMNVAGRFRYSTPGGVDDFAAYTFTHSMASALKANCGCRVDSSLGAPRSAEQNPALSRFAALAPGGPATNRFLAHHPVVLVVGSTVFVHGGLLPHHIDYGLERLNAETRAWMLGEAGGEMPRFLGGRDAVVWARDYSQEDEQRCNCKLLEQSLARIPGAERMVVGHTIQAAGINSACDGRVFRIDVGLSHGCGDGEPEVLEILKDREIRSLKEGGRSRTLAGDEAGTATWRWWQRERRREDTQVAS